MSKIQNPDCCKQCGAFLFPLHPMVKWSNRQLKNTTPPDKFGDDLMIKAETTPEGAFPVKH